MVHRVNRVQLVHRVCLDSPVTLGQSANVVVWASLVLREVWEIRVGREQMVHQVRTDYRGLRVLKEKTENPARRAIPDFAVLSALKVCLVLGVALEHQELLVSKEAKVRLVNLDRRETEVYPGTRVNQ